MLPFSLFSPQAWQDTLEIVAYIGVDNPEAAARFVPALEEGRTFQCGEGWHSNEHAVRLWIPSPRVPQETDTRCYAFTTAYATMIPRCNVC